MLVPVPMSPPLPRRHRAGPVPERTEEREPEVLVHLGSRDQSHHAKGHARCATQEFPAHDPSIFGGNPHRIAPPADGKLAPRTQHPQSSPSLRVSRPVGRPLFYKSAAGATYIHS